VWHTHHSTGNWENTNLLHRHSPTPNSRALLIYRGRIEVTTAKLHNKTNFTATTAIVPLIDDKIITSRIALGFSTSATYQTFGDERYLNLAMATATYLK
jgi:uncharacterized protein YyaL (SSP411 family)